MKELYEDLHEACEVTGRELGDIVDKVRAAGGKMSTADLEALDKLTHSIKSIKTTMAMLDGESEAYDAYARGRNRSYGDSYARRRDSMGRYTRRAYDDMMDDRR